MQHLRQCTPKGLVGSVGWTGIYQGYWRNTRYSPIYPFLFSRLEITLDVMTECSDAVLALAILLVVAGFSCVFLTTKVSDNLDRSHMSTAQNTH